MDSITLAEAEGRLAELIAGLDGGEVLTVTQDGRPVARIVGVERAPPALEALQRWVDENRDHVDATAEFMRRFRNEERY